MPPSALPYFDRYFAEFQRDSSSFVAQIFHRHVHWGCYEPHEADDESIPTYWAAAERLTSRMCEAGGARDGQRILDVGCGFGGTIRSLDEWLADCQILGVNIDRRQLDRASALLQRSGRNAVSFVAANASSLPFKDSTFDLVISVEAIFHFPSRLQFLRDAGRLLKPGGRLVLSDFVVNAARVTPMTTWLSSTRNRRSGFYGSSANPISSQTYARVGARAKLRRIGDVDLTQATLPTYRVLRTLYSRLRWADAVADNDFLEELAQRGFVQYRVMVFEPTG